MCLFRGLGTVSREDEECICPRREGKLHTKVYAMNQVGLAPKADEKVVWLDIPVDEALVVNVFNTLQQLIRNHEDGFELEFPAARTIKLSAPRARYLMGIQSTCADQSADRSQKLKRSSSDGPRRSITITL